MWTSRHGLVNVGGVRRLGGNEEGPLRGLCYSILGIIDRSIYPPPPVPIVYASLP